MTFLRMPDKVSVEEAMTFNYWAVTLRLLNLGFPWEQVQAFTLGEISLILGLQAALDQRRMEQEAVSQRQAQATQRRIR